MGIYGYMYGWIVVWWVEKGKGINYLIWDRWKNLILILTA